MNKLNNNALILIIINKLCCVIFDIYVVSEEYS